MPDGASSNTPPAGRAGDTLFVDIGNTSIGVGVFGEHQDSQTWWRQTHRHWQWRPDHSPPWEDLESLGDLKQPRTWVVASVNRDITQQLRDSVAARYPDDRWETLASDQFPIHTTVNPKSAVGADRLAAVVAANALRDSDRAAVVVDAGSAINVELIDESGVFRGGAIFPGMAMAARALAVGTDLLPTVTPSDEPPAPVGTNTAEAIRSGLYWGAWGAIRELVARFTDQCSSPPHVMLTGGGILWRDLQVGASPTPEVEVYPHLVLSGIALAWSMR